MPLHLGSFRCLFPLDTGFRAKRYRNSFRSYFSLSSWYTIRDKKDDKILFLPTLVRVDLKSLFLKVMCRLMRRSAAGINYKKL